jgi:putative ABC transport system ATP-binding protein
MPENIIELRKVKKSYRLGETVVPALRDVSLELHKGEFTALVGASGSGKSTLLNLVGGLDGPDEGAVLIEGQDIGRLSDDALSRLRNQKIGFIFQSFNLCPVLDVYENVELPLLINPKIPAGERRARVERALEDVGIAEYARHRPDKLSGGQRQRVAIARTLAGEPLIILADEPTASLDSVTTHRIIDLMLELNARRGVTFFFSTHDEKLMSRVARTVRIHDGQIVA